MMRSQSHSRTSSTSRSRSSVSSSGSSVGGGLGGGFGMMGASGSIMGSSSFMVGRERNRQAEMELFSQSRKPRSNYRRPSNLGFSTSCLASKSEQRTKFTPLPASRAHIVQRIPDHLKMEGGFSKDTEISASYRNLSPARPVRYRLQDSLKVGIGGSLQCLVQPQGKISLRSETATSFQDNNAKRPVIHKLRDHNEMVKPVGPINKTSEYRKNFSVLKGERVQPAWVNNFEKVTIDGGDSRQ